MRHARFVIPVIALWGCARGGFTDVLKGDTGSADASVAEGGLVDGQGGGDAVDGAVTGACLPWGTGWALTEPESVDELNSSSGESEITLTADGLTIYFASSRTGGVGQGDLYRATRPRLDAPFGDVANMTALNSAETELRLALSADQRTAALNTARPGGFGVADIWIALDRDPTTPLDISQFEAPANLNTSGPDYDPYLTLDGQRLYYVIVDWSEGIGRHDIVFAQRPAAGGGFSSPVLLGGVNTADIEDNPALTADELVIVFGSDRPGGEGKTDVWMAQRASPQDPFSAPTPLDALNTADDERETFISADGCEVYFASDRPHPTHARRNIYRSRLLRR